MILLCCGHNMMTSSNGNIFRVTGHLCGEFTDPRWISRTKASDAELWCSLICVWINGWINNREAGDLRRYRAHYDVTVMTVCLRTFGLYDFQCYVFNKLTYKHLHIIVSRGEQLPKLLWVLIARIDWSICLFCNSWTHVTDMGLRLVHDLHPIVIYVLYVSSML